MDFEEINKTLVKLADTAMEQSGLSHTLYVKRFSSAVDREFNGAASEVWATVYVLASEYDYLPLDAR